MREVEPRQASPDGLALLVFLKALELVGGPEELVRRRHLTWVPTLMEAAYAVVLRERYARTEDEIARHLGVSVQTVRQMLRADPERVQARLEADGAADAAARDHVAGGLAKRAYRELRHGTPRLGLLDRLHEALDALRLEEPGAA